MEKYDAVIIGGGLGGLLCGNILSREGFNVCLIEKNNKLGGALQTFGRKGCIFNTGLNYTESLDEGQVLNRYFRYFGLLDKLPLSRLDEGGFEVIHFKDGEYRRAMGHSLFLETLTGSFPHEKKGLEEYDRKIREICTSIPFYTFDENDSGTNNSFDLSTGAAQFIRSVISDQRLQNVLAGNNLLYAGHEGKTPLFIHSLISSSFVDSAWRIKDGSHQLVNILAGDILANGGTILRGQKAEKFIMEDRTIRFVRLANGHQVEGNNFIMNTHPQQLLDMVDPSILRNSFINRIRSLEDTMGMFTLYLIFKKNSFPYLNYNYYHYNQDNVWIASDYKPALWPQGYLFMTTADSGYDNYAKSGSVISYMDIGELAPWFNTFTGNRGNDYLDFKEARASRLLDMLETQFPGITSCVEARYTSTPLTWRDYTGTRAGSAYGILKDCNRPMESMILPRTKIPNLLFTGQNSNVHGILGVTISSVITCSELLNGKYLLEKIRNV